MALFDKNKGQKIPVLNNSSNVIPPNVNLVDDVDYKAARTANEATVMAEAAALAAAKAAKEAKDQADRAKEEADSIIDDYNGWQDAMDKAEDALDAANDAIDEAKSAVRAADVVYYGFMNMKVSAESIPADQDADAIWTPAKNTLDFKIPKGLDGTIEGLADAPVIEDVDKNDYIMVVDSGTDAVSKATIDDFLDLTVKSVNGYTPDDSGNIIIPSDTTAPVLYLGESLLMVATTAPAGTVPADGKVYNRSDFPDLWSQIESGQLASVSDEDWLAGKNDVFSVGNGSTTFRVPKFTDNGDIVMTEGNYTLNGNITIAGGLTVPLMQGKTIQNGDYIVEDTSRSVGIDTYIVNRMAGEGTDNAYAAVGFVDRRDNNKTIGGLYADELTNDVGVLSNMGDAILASQTGDTYVVASAGDVNVTGDTIGLNGDIVASNDLAVTGDVTAATVTTTGEVKANSLTAIGVVNGSSATFKHSTGSALVQITQTGDSTSSFIDMCSGTGHSDFDVRLLTTGGNATTSGGGTLAITAYAANFGNANINTSGVVSTGDINGNGTLRNAGDVWVSGNTILGNNKALYLHDSDTTQFDAFEYQANIGQVNVGNAAKGLGLYSNNIIQCHGNVVIDEGRGYWQQIGGENTRLAAYENAALQLNSNTNYGVNITGAYLHFNGGPLPQLSDIEAVHEEYRPIIEELRAEIAALKEKLNA